MSAPPGAVRVAVHLHAGGGVRVGAGVDPTQLVLDVRERLQDLALGELVAEPGDTFTVAAVAARAAGVHDSAFAERPGDLLGRRCERTHVHEGPQRQCAERGERPERDLLAGLGRGDDGDVGLRRRGTGRNRWCSRPGRHRRCGCRLDARRGRSGRRGSGVLDGSGSALGLRRVRPCCASAGAREFRSRVPTIDGRMTRSGNPLVDSGRWRARIHNQSIVPIERGRPEHERARRVRRKWQSARHR